MKARVFLPSILSGVLLWTAYFPLNWWGVAFVAMAPFLTLVRAEGIGRWRRYTAAWVGGLTFGGLAARWLGASPEPVMAYFAWPGVALFLSLFWPIALYLLRRLDRRDDAAAAYRAALALEMNDADRAFLERRLAEVTA